MKRMKWVEALIAAAVALALLAGCSGRSQGSAAATAQGGFDANGYWTGETVELTMFVGGDFALAYNKRLDTRTMKELEKRTGVRMSWDGVDIAKSQIMLNSGDLRDLVNSTLTNDQVLTGHYHALDDLVAKWGKDMMDTIAWAVERRNTYEDGKIYNIPTGNGPMLRQDYPTWVRWDWFKEIGAPDIYTWRDYLDALRKIQDKHPRTEDGYPIYGMTSFNEWGFGYAWAPTWNQVFGYGSPYLGEGIWTSLSGDKILHYIWEDEPNPFFDSVLLMTTAKWMGILDPDCFVQSYEEMKGKRDRGQYVSMFSDYLVREWNPKYGPQGSAYEPLPWKGGKAYVNGYTTVISGSGFGYAIPKTSKDPDAAMRWINYVCSYDGAELLYNGVQGIDWVIGSDGKPTLTDSFIADNNKGLLDPDVTGFPHDPSQIGLSSLAIDPRYDRTVRWTMDPTIAALSNNKTDQDFSDHFGVLSPHDAIKQAVIRGDMLGDGNFPAMATRVDLGDVPINIAQTKAQIQELMDTQAALLFNTNNEEEFNAVKQQVIARFKQLDLKAYEAYYSDVWQKALKLAGY